METPRLLSLPPSPLKHSQPITPLFPTSRTSTSSSSSSSSSSGTFIHCCYTNKQPPRTNKSSTRTKTSYWDSNAETSSSGRFKFNFKDQPLEYDGDEDEGEGDYSSGSSRFQWRDSRRKKRKWWSDVDDDDEEYNDDGLRGGNGVVEDVIENVWFFKVLRSYGWLLPAIIISMLLASGPKAFLMAIALPLGQSALSFAIEKVFGRTRDRPKPRSRTKRKPFARAASSIDIEEELDEGDGIDKEKKGYQSWVATDSGPVQQKEDRSNPSFGGWDELDRQQGSDTRRRRQTKDGPPRAGSEKGKMSRRRRQRDTPLLLRLLISVFPFLGSWTRLL